MIGTRECQHPTCTRDSENTYNGRNGNTLRLCDRHYYNLVTREGSSGGGIGTLLPAYQFRDSTSSSTETGWNTLGNELDMGEDTADSATLTVDGEKMAELADISMGLDRERGI